MNMRDINRAVALSGWIFILLTCAMLIVPWIIELTRNGTSDKEVVMLAIGYLFGAATTMIKEIMLKPEE